MRDIGRVNAQRGASAGATVAEGYRAIERWQFSAGFRRVLDGLGEIHGDIGLLDQIIVAHAVDRINGNADARRHRNRIVVDRIGFGQPEADLLRHLQRAFPAIDLGQQQNKLVATVATRRVASSNTR